MHSLRFTQKNSFKTLLIHSTFAFAFPLDVSDDGDDDDGKAVTINQFCYLKLRDVTMDSGRWNSSMGRLRVIGSLSEKIRVSGLNA